MSSDEKRRQKKIMNILQMTTQLSFPRKIWKIWQKRQ